MKLKSLQKALFGTLALVAIAPLASSAVGCNDAAQEAISNRHRNHLVEEFIPKEISISDQSSVEAAVNRIKNRFLSNVLDTKWKNDMSNELNVTLTDEDGNQITDEILKDKKSITVKAIFSYKNKEMTGKIKINRINKNEIFIQKFQQSEYTYDMKVFNEEELKKAIDGKYLKNNFDNLKFRSQIDESKFSDINIKNLNQNGQKLDFSNPDQIKNFNATIQGKYDKMPFSVKLKINIYNGKLNDQEIVNLLNKEKLILKIKKDKTVKNEVQKLNKLLEKTDNKLPSIISQWENMLKKKGINQQITWSKLQFLSHIKNKNGENLTETDIRNNTFIVGTIDFQFGEQQGKLKIEITNNKRMRNIEEKIVNEIQKSEFNLDTEELNSGVEKITNKLKLAIEAKFILKPNFEREKLTNIEILTSPSKAKKTKAITENDLATAGEKKLKFKFTYNSHDFTSRKQSVKLNVVPSPEQIRKEIEQHTYSIRIKPNVFAAIKNNPDYNISTEKISDNIKIIIQNKIDKIFGVLSKGLINKKSYLDKNQLLITNITKPQEQTSTKDNNSIATCIITYKYNGGPELTAKLSFTTN